MGPNYCSILKSPLGDITIIADDEAVHTISFSRKEVEALEPNLISETTAHQLQAYFEGTLNVFTFAIKQNGTEFQKTVWEKLLSIPFGDTLSYLKLSQQLNNPLAIRAIAAANGKNNLAIVVPCHRVIGSDGKLVGYAGELWRKQWLLDHEKTISGKGQMILRYEY